MVAAVGCSTQLMVEVQIDGGLKEENGWGRNLVLSFGRDWIWEVFNNGSKRDGEEFVTLTLTKLNFNNAMLEPYPKRLGWLH